MKLRGFALALLAATLVAAPASAHHPFAVHFAADRLVTVRGAVDFYLAREVRVDGRPHAPPHSRAGE